jgi:ectoine hydroxylase-related dioxygenase (phytanoyl-CoA dioxygenase family)
MLVAAGRRDEDSGETSSDLHSVDTMPYPDATPEQIGFFREHGYLVVGDAIPQADLDQLEGHCNTLIDEKERLANDWAWDAKESRDQRPFRTVQPSPALVWKDIGEQAHRRWLVSFASQLMGMELEFWYDQFLGKPPGRSVPTEWHQDEGYWGRNLADRGITGWIPLQDVDRVNGCMHFIDGGHVHGVLPHRLVEGMQSDLLICEVDETRTVACPMRRGDVAFHHSKTPHMSTANTGTAWRKAVTNHLQAVGAGGEGGHYPWRVKVNQKTGARVIPESSPLKQADEEAG